MAASLTTSISTAEWILDRNDRSPIDTAVFAAIGNAEKSNGLLPVLAKLVVDYLECYQCFGEREWIKLCGRVSPAPLLPHGFSSIWNGPCPAFPGKKVRDSHMLVYIPKTVTEEEKPLTLKSLGEITKRHFLENQDDYIRYINQNSDSSSHIDQYCVKAYSYIEQNCVETLGDQSIDKSCWILMTTDVLPESRKKSYVIQKNMVADLVKEAPATYEVPQTLKASVCILTHFFYSRELLFRGSLGTNTHRTYTRCQEDVQGRQIIVGGFTLDGLIVNISHFDSDDIGIAALRKL